MLLVVTRPEQENNLSKKYNDKVQYINKDVKEKEEIIKYLEEIKQSCLSKEITIINYDKVILELLDKLSIKYIVVIQLINKAEYKNVSMDRVLEVENTIDTFLSTQYKWIEDENRELTLKQLATEDITLTESDVRSFKELENKLKVSLLLQAKTSLNRVLKLTSMLDKLQDAMTERIDMFIDDFTVWDLVRLTESISRTIQDTNSFILNLINNEKVQNYFIVQNNNVNIGDSAYDINKREKIRKAVEIVLNNIDLYQEGNYAAMQNPNTVEVETNEK
nr:MAG TPA: hypothetical protein [Caudoviricetes sp.]